MIFFFLEYPECSASRHPSLAAPSARGRRQAQISEHCLYLERVLADAMDKTGLSCFPILVGRKPSSTQSLPQSRVQPASQAAAAMPRPRQTRRTSPPALQPLLQRGQECPSTATLQIIRMSIMDENSMNFIH